MRNFTHVKAAILTAALLLPIFSLAQLSGSYTINKNGSGSRNYQSFGDAVTALNQNGVSGAVVFNVTNDTFTEQVTLNFVSGSSNSNTITFKGNDSSRCVLQHGASQYGAVVQLKAANYFRFEKLTIKSTDRTYGYGIHITAGADHTEIKNCIVEVSTTSGSADNIPINIAGTTYNSNGDNGEDVTVDNCIIKGGYYGINMRGTNTGLLSDGLYVSNTTFEDVYYMGIYNLYVADLQVDQCTIDDIRLYYGYGIYTYANSGGHISNSKIYAGRYGIFMNLHNFYNRSDSVVVYNNEISDFGDASYQVGIYSSNCYNLRAYHNSIRVDGSVSSSSYPAMYVSRPNNHVILNNAIASYGNSEVMYLGSGTLGNTRIDYNCYKTGNGNFVSWQGTSYANLSQLQTANSSQNQNCKVADPDWSGKRILVPRNPGLNNAAIPGIGSNDLAGNQRPLSPDTIPDIGAYEYYVAPSDIDIIDMYDPVIAQLQTNTVSAVLKNNGSAAFSDSVFISYKIGSNSWVADTAIYSNLGIGSTDTFTFTQGWTATNKGTYQACLAINPMVQGDPDSTLGDTFCTTKCIGQQGSFTIDPSGNGDFRTFTAAVAALNCGISGPITFKVKPGTYNENITLTEVTGASATNTVTFVGDDRDRVILRYQGTSNSPATILLDNADHMIFKKITVENSGSTIGAGFWLKDQCQNITIDSCNILLDTTSNQPDVIGIVAANALSGGTILPGNRSNNNRFTNNFIQGGGYGIRINGASTQNHSENINIFRNTFRLQFSGGILNTYVSKATYRQNRITETRSLASYGIYLYRCGRDTVDANVVQSGRFGIYTVFENFDDRNGFSLVSNNMVSNMLDPTYQVGIIAYLAYNVNIYHNSVWTTHTFSSPFYAALALYSSNNCNAKNNALKAENGGRVFSGYYGTINITAVDNNNYYCTANAKYTWDGLIFSDLSTWKSITSNQNANSIEGDPGFISETDLHASGAQLNNKGQSKLAIDLDIDGHKRPFAPDKRVDIGADEFYVSPYDLDVVSLDSPIVPIRGNNNVIITLRNAGQRDLSVDTVVLRYTINGSNAVYDTVVINSLKATETYQHTFSTPWNLNTSSTYTLCAGIDTFYKPDPDTNTVEEKCRTMCPGAKGTYVIDKGGNGDFRSFRAAIKSLDCGISGNVIFEVKDANYFERIHLKEIKGASANARIRFVGESRSQTVVNYTGQRDSHAVVHLEGADYITFENMTFSNSRAFWAKGVDLSSGADYNEFIDVTINLDRNTTNGTVVGIYATNDLVNAVGVAANYNTFRGVNVNGGYYGARMDGEGTTTLIYGNEFYDCQFSENAYFNFYSLYGGEFVFDGCRFLDTRIDYWNVYLNRPTEVTFINNYLVSGRRGVYAYLDNYEFQENVSLYANNQFVDGYDNGNTEMVDFYLSYNTKFYHNSINLTEGNGGYAMRYRSGSGHDVQNNSIAKSTAAELMVNTSAAFVNIDHNNYYAGSSSNYVSFNGTSFSNLTQWKNGVNGFNKNSRDGDPKYQSSTDLTIQPKSTQLSNWGAVISEVTEDFEGDIRNTYNPDVGADEYSDLYDIGITALISPSTGCKLTRNEQMQVVVKNLGAIAVTSGELIPVEYRVNNSTIVLDTFALQNTLSAGDSITFTFTQTFDFAAAGSYNVVTWTDIANDSNRNNDTFQIRVRSFEEPNADFSYSNLCTIDGTNFTDATSLNTSSISQYSWSFGNGNTSTNQNPSNIYSSDGNYTTKLVVTTAQGCKDSVEKTLTIGEKPTAKFNLNNLCFGDSTRLSNTSSIATASNAAFLWTFGDGDSSTAINPVHQYQDTGSYTVTLLATAANGCTDTTSTSADVSPVPTASFSTNDVCYGDSAAFTNNSSIPSGFTASYDWDFGDANSSSASNPKHLYSTIGSYLVELTTTLNNGCVDTEQDTVVVESTPSAEFSAKDACDEDTVAFQNTSSIGNGTISQYNWSFGDNNSSTVGNPKHLYANSGSYTVQLKATSTAGCADSTTETVVVNVKPNASIVTDTVCVGNASKYTNNSAVSAGSLTYTWRFGDGFSSTQSSPSHTYASRGVYGVSLVATSDSGCTDTAYGNAYANAVPSVAFNVSNLCFGDTLRPQNNSTIGAGSISQYNWSFGDGNSSTQTSPENRYTSKGTYDVKLVATSNNGCKDSLTKQVKVDNVLVPGFTFNTGCKGDSTFFTNTTNTSCGTISSYQWIFGDGNSSSNVNPRHLYANAGSYTVQLIVTQQGGAKDTSTQTVTIDPLPSLSFSTNNVCALDTAQFSNSTTIASGIISQYEWQFGDGNKSSVANATHVYNQSGNYTVKLIATSNKGCKDSSTATFTAYELPSVDFSASAVCLGRNVNFSNNSSINSGSLSYSWNFGNGFSSSQTSPSYSYASAGSYNVTLTATSNRNCVAATTKSIRVNPNPSVQFSVRDTCANDAVKFINSSTISSGSVTYKWYFGDGDSSSTVQPSHVYGTAGSYTAQLVATSNAGCVSSASRTARAFPVPTAGFSLPGSCSGTRLTFTNTSTLGSGTLSHNWNFGDGNSSTSQSPTHTYGSTGNYTVKLITTSNRGCVDSVSKLAQVYDIPSASYSASGTCLGDSTTFTNGSSIASGSMTYSWDFGDGSSSSATSPKHQYASAGSYQVKLVVTSNWGCKDSSTQTVVINPSPNASFSANDVCLGSTTSFTNNSSIASGNISYFWDFDNGSASTQKTTSITYAAANTYDVLLRVTSNNGCVDSVINPVVVNPNPSPNFSFAQKCLGDTTRFTNTSSIGSGTMTYRWDFDNGNQSTMSQPAQAFSTSGQYDIELRATSNSGCISTITKTLHISPAPNVAFAAANVCDGQNVSFNNNSSISSGSMQYNWRLGDGNTSNQNNPSHLYSSAGSYNVVLTASSDSGCVDSLLHNMVVNPAPTAGLRTTDVCRGDATSFSDNSSINNGNITGYSWSFGDGFTDNKAITTHTYASRGTYNVELVVSSDSACTDTATTTVDVYAQPTANFSAGNVCFGDTLFPINNSSIGAGSITSYSWDFDDGTTSSAASPSHYYATQGTYDIQLKVRSNNGCEDSTTKQVTADITIVPGFSAQDACIGNAISFTNTTNSSCGNITGYLWEFDDGNTSTQTSPSHNYATAGSYNVRLIVTQASGNSDTTTKQVNVFALPSAAFTAQNACADEVVSLSNNSSIASGSISQYEWRFGDGTKNSATLPSKQYSNAGTYRIWLKAISNQGCADSTDTSITIHHLPNVQFGMRNVCLNDSIAFTNSSTVSQGNLTYNWRFGDGNASTSASPTHFYANDGSFGVWLKATSNNGCSDSLRKTVHVHPLPIANFGFTQACNGDATNFYDSTSLSQGSVQQYAWNFGNGFTSNSQNPVHTYSNSGSYNAQLIVTSDSGCVDTSVNSVRVFATPSAQFSASNICLGDTLKPINNSTVSGSNSLQYVWRFGNGDTAMTPSPAYVYQSRGTYTVTLVASTANGCQDSTTQQVVADVTLVPGFNASTSCAGDSTVFTNTTNVSCGNISSYQWLFGDGNSSSASNPKHLYAQAGSYNVRLIVTQQGGASDTIAKRINVNYTPNANFFGSNACAKTAISFNNLSTIASGSINQYEWDFGDGFKSSSNNPNHDFDTAGTFTVKLKAYGNTGCVESISRNITIYPLPVAKFSAQDVCFGKAVRFQNNSTISSGTMNYAWDFGDGFSSSSNSPSYNYSADGKYQVKLTATSNNSCTNSITKTVTVKAAPNVAFTAADTCAGSELRLVNNTTTSSGTLNYHWTFGDGTSSTDAAPSKQFALSGSYSIKLVAESQDGCKDSVQNQVRILSTPNAQFSYSSTCPGDAVDFQNTSTSTLPLIGQVWQFTGSDTSMRENPSYSFTNAEPHNVILLVGNAVGCIDTAMGRVQYQAVPNTDFSISGVACENDTVSFTNTTTINTGSITYQWNFGDGNSSTDENPEHFFADYISGKAVQLIATSSFGCSDSVTKTVNFTNAPNADFSYAEACMGQLTRFDNLSDNLGANSYTWNFGDGNTASQVNPLHTYTGFGAFTVTLSADNGTCTDSIVKQVDVLQGPQNLDFSFTNQCEGDTVQFINNTTNTNLSYRWIFFDGTFSNAKEPSKYYPIPGEYTVGFEASEGNCADSTYKIIEIYEAPDAAFTYTVVDNTVTFTSADTSLYDFEWTFGDGNSSFFKDPVNNYSSDGTYTVTLKVTTPNGCSETSSQLISIEPNSIAYGEHALHMSIYPNPFSTEAKIELDIDHESDVMLEVYDAMGRRVELVAQQNLSAGHHVYALNPSAYPDRTATYFVRLTVDGKSLTQRLIKLR